MRRLSVPSWAAPSLLPHSPPLSPPQQRPGSGSSVVSSCTYGGRSMYSSYAPSAYAASSYRRAGSVCGRSVRLGGLSAIMSESGSPPSTRAPSVLGGRRSSLGRPQSSASSSVTVAGAGVIALRSIAEGSSHLSARRASEEGSAYEAEQTLEELDADLFANQLGEHLGEHVHYEDPYELPLTFAPINRLDAGPEAKGANDGVLSRQLNAAAPAAPAAEAFAVTLEQKLALLRSLQFTREVQMPFEVLSQVAEWLEVQRFERYRVISAESAWCHSLYMLAHGVAEVRELGVGVQQVPLEPGSYWGESALAPELPKLPLAFSVVAVEPCVLLVLRQHKVQQKLPELVPYMRNDWVDESRRVRAACWGGYSGKVTLGGLLGEVIALGW